jgi:type I restriction enzyme M protein
MAKQGTLGKPTRPVSRKTGPLIKTKPVDTEVEAYKFILDQLNEHGWNIRCPGRQAEGQVWTQNQCFMHPEIKKALGTTRPENIVKLSETRLWVIEAKRDLKALDQAIKEAADDYAAPIIRGGVLDVAFISGVAGNEASGYLVRTLMRIKDQWHVVTINGQTATALLTPSQIDTLIRQGTPAIKDYVPPPTLFLRTAERINAILHVGGINLNERAKVMASLLLAVIDEPGPNVDADLAVLIEEIGSRARHVLRKNGKPEFAPFITIIPPTNSDNHVKYKRALVHTLQELRNLNIKSAMNSSTDVLGQFYEVFLKYGNGAKEIGIVLTPRHITRFAVEVVGISSNDVVLDPACGTGGFLVAAFDHVRRMATPVQLERFRLHNLFGVEEDASVAVLAIVNMIFRGDGRNHIVEGNCFITNLTRQTVDGHPSAKYIKTPPKVGEEPVTRVLMNPPFAKGDDSKEYLFVKRALGMMDHGGILFSLLPLGAMFREGDERVWREQNLLAHNTLLAVVSLPERLFVPAANKQVLAIIVRQGIPHPKNQPVFWARVSHDGHLVVKSRRLPAADFEPPRKESNQLDEILPNLRAFVAAPGSVTANEPEFCKTAPIDFSDPLLELIPEAYIDSRAPTLDEIREAVDGIARETVSYLVKFRKEDEAEAFDGTR